MTTPPEGKKFCAFLQPSLPLSGFFSLLLLLCGALSSPLRAAEVIPPAPPNHFNDYAGAVNRATAQQLNNELDQFERQTSNQLLVAIFPRMQSDSSIEDYTTRVFESWKVGRKGISNGAVLFIFVQDRSLRIQTGYGLEGALPDVLCKQIIENEITPRFRAGDFDGGVRNGVNAMMAATRGEYRGDGRTVNDSDGQVGGLPIWAVFIFIFLIIVFSRLFRGNSSVYTRGGRRTVWIGGGGWNNRGGGGWSSGGGGGGTFSGGGGSTGGGGASGRW